MEDRRGGGGGGGGGGSGNHAGAALALLGDIIIFICQLKKIMAPPPHKKKSWTYPWDLKSAISRVPLSLFSISWYISFYKLLSLLQALCPLKFPVSLSFLFHPHLMTLKLKLNLFVYISNVSVFLFLQTSFTQLSRLHSWTKHYNNCFSLSHFEHWHMLGGVESVAPSTQIKNQTLFSVRIKGPTDIHNTHCWRTLLFLCFSAQARPKGGGGACDCTCLLDVKSFCLFFAWQLRNTTPPPPCLILTIHQSDYVLHQNKHRPIRKVGGGGRGVGVWSQPTFRCGGHFMKLIITDNLSFTDKYSDILDFDMKLWSTVTDCCHGNSQWMTNCQWWQVSWRLFLLVNWEAAPALGSGDFFPPSFRTSLPLFPKCFVQSCKTERKWFFNK